ncbi:MAG TPA: cytosine permease [Candidatus Baltobacteraceae bacterium]|nr:cytosine permease [Candidatus Baltobacteraceae bacterium]
MSPAEPSPYGASVVAVEPHGLDPIGDAERHGRPRDLFFLWFGANAETAPFAVGILTVALYGTSLAGAALGVVAGNVLAYLIVGLLSRAGPRYGVPQMVASRLTFGRDGNLIPAVLAFLAGVGWFAISSAFGAQALAALAHLRYPLALTMVLAAQVLIAVYGHNAIHVFERYASAGLVAGFAVISVATLALAKLAAPFDPGAPFASGGETGGIVFSAALAFAYAVGWGPGASDYSRYLPRASDPRAVTAWAFLGGFVPCTLLEMVGAAAVAATHAPGLASATPADTIVLLAHGKALVAAIGLATVLLGTISANSLNLYSGALAALVAWDARRRLSSALGAAAFLAALTVAVLVLARANDPTARFGAGVVAVAAVAVGALGFAVVRWTLVRWQSAIAVGALGGALAFGAGDPRATAHLYESFLGLLTMWAAPWAGVMLARRAPTALRTDTRALLAWAGGIAVSIPFWQQSWYTGPLAAAHPQWGDLSYFIAFAASFALAAQREESSRASEATG